MSCKVYYFLVERDEKDLKDRPLKGPGGREFKGLKDIFTDDTKSKCILYNFSITSYSLVFKLSGYCFIIELPF